MVLRLNEDWRKFVEGKLRKKKRRTEGITWRTVEKLVKKQHEKTEKPFSWTQEEEQQKQPWQPKKNTPAAAGEGGAGNKNASKAEKDQWFRDGLCTGWMTSGACRFGDICKYGHEGAGGQRQTTPKKAAKEQPMSIEQHAAVVRYAEEKGKDASEVKWETVEKDGGLDKWRAKIDKPSPNPKVFPMLVQRRRKSEKERESGIYAIMVQKEPLRNYRDVVIEAEWKRLELVDTHVRRKGRGNSWRLMLMETVMLAQ